MASKFLGKLFRGPLPPQLHHERPSSGTLTELWQLSNPSQAKNAMQALCRHACLVLETCMKRLLAREGLQLATSGSCRILPEEARCRRPLACAPEPSRRGAPPGQTATCPCPASELGSPQGWFAHCWTAGPIDTCTRSYGAVSHYSGP